MLNSFLNLTATACLIAPVVLFVVHTVCYVTSPVVPVTAPIVAPAAPPEPAPKRVALAMPAVATLSIEAEPIDHRALSAAELRRRCSQSGIQWRNAHGKNKHLSKRQMLAALD